MPNHDQEGLFDRARKLKPSRFRQPKDNRAKSDANEVHRTEPDVCEQDMSEISTRWQRIKESPAFKPVLTAGGLAVAGGVLLLALRSQEGMNQVSAVVLEKIPELTGAAFEAIREEASRRSPVEHAVKGYERLQHFGPGGTETKIVQILPYSRGGSA